MATVPNLAPLQSTSGSVAASNSITINLSQPTTSGSGCYISSQNISSGTNKISSISGGGTWVSVGNHVFGSTAIELWKLENATAGVSTITVTLSSSLNYIWTFSEFSGVLATGSLDVTANAGNSFSSNANLTATTATVSQEVELCICVGGALGNGTVMQIGAPTGYTQLQNPTTSATTQSSLSYFVRTGAVSAQSASSPVTVVGGTTNDAVAVIACFKAVANVIQLRQAATNYQSANNQAGPAISAPRHGNLQLAIITRQSTTANQTTSITQTGATWTKLLEINGPLTCSNEIWWSRNAGASDANTIIAHFNATIAVAVTYLEFYGMGIVPSVDQSVTSSGVAGTMSTGTTSATTQTPELAIAGFGFLAAMGAAPASITNGYIIGEGNIVSSGQVGAWALYSILTALAATSTSVSPGAGGTTSGDYASTLITFTSANPPNTLAGFLQLLNVGE